MEEFRRMGVGLVWSRGENPNATRVTVRIAILPHDATDWGVAGKTLGATRRDDHGSSIFVFFPAVERALGDWTGTSRISRPGLTPQEWYAGLARIIAHEILHTLLPERSHDGAGVFAADVTVGTLVARELVLEPETRAALHERLCSRGAVAERF